MATGSVGFKDALSGNQHWFEGTQLVVISNTQWVGENMPCLTYGMRGMIALSIEVRLLPFDVRCVRMPSCFIVCNCVCHDMKCIVYGTCGHLLRIM